MSELIIRRRLWYVDGRDRVVVDQDFLRDEPRSLVLLGEAGMGKSTLLEQLGRLDGFALCTARKLINSPDPGVLLTGATTLVVDALDEVSARQEGDAVDLVLNRLAKLGLPRFVLSCRIADWRSATAIQGITDFYDCKPLELHIESLDREDAAAFLATTLGDAAAEGAIEHLEEHGLTGLLRNPQTLELVGKVAAEGRLPDSKGELFEEATRLLRAEHRKEKAGSPLTSLPEAAVLEAAGASFAALILTGKETISREVDVEESDVLLSELSALPGAAWTDEVMASRLFEARAPGRFTYVHRAVGEFLGARYLGACADTPRKRRRLLEMFNNQGLVPASLRGIHAWLAWHSPSLADRVIAADPMGVVEYGDADALTPSQAKALLSALYDVSRENPRFRDWSEYRASGLVQPAMKNEVRKVVTDTSAEFGLRLLVLQALRGSPLVSELRDVLLAVLLEANAAYALRSEAGDRLLEPGNAVDWPDLVQRLVARDNENDVRLASELMDGFGYEQFTDALVLDMVKALTQRSERPAGILFGLEHNFPEGRLDALLDGVAATALLLGDRDERPDSESLADLAFALLARRLAGPAPNAARLWSWLAPFDSHSGVQQESPQAVAKALEANDELRRAVQRHVLLEQRGDQNVWQRNSRMLEPMSRLQPSEDDVIALLAALDLGDPRWRELVELVRHGPENGAAVRAEAKRFANGDADAEAWLAAIAEPRVPEWQVQQEERLRRRAAERQKQWEIHRAEFAARIDAMRVGEFGAVVNPAKAYLKLFHDLGDRASDGPSRLEEWLGPELRDAALAGFEAFLTATPPVPTASDIAASHAKSMRFDAAFVVIAALAERMRTHRGFDDLSNERLMAGHFELANTRLDEHAGVHGLHEQLTGLLRVRGIWEEAQRGFFEPQLAVGSPHVSGLYRLMRSDEDAELALRLGAEWLERFPDISGEAEIEIVDGLLARPSGQAALRAVLPWRLAAELDDERRLTWTAVGIILDFEATRARLERAGPIDKDLFWSLRARLGDRRRNETGAGLNTIQLAWAIRTFRPYFPYTGHPEGGWAGDVNPWDATEYLITMVNRLGDEVSPGATEALVALRDAAVDGYTTHLRVALAEQKRKRMEADWAAPDLPTLAAAMVDGPPTTAPQLQAVMLEELVSVQAKVRGSDVDWYRDFLDAEEPRGEEHCRDTILKMFGELPFRIQAHPEGHLADDKRCDILCTLSGLMVPIEVKGQWHKDLWTAADRQLDLLYTNDWRAERGIYLVLWFGPNACKQPRKPPAGADTPMTAEALRTALAVQSATTLEGRTEIVVLDLTRPA